MTHCGSCTDAQCWGCQTCAKALAERDKLREQLADAEQARHDSQELGVLAMDENAQLRAQLAQHAAGLTRLRALTDKWDRPFRAGSCCMQAADGAVFDCMLELHVALAGLPDEKEKP